MQTIVILEIIFICLLALTWPIFFSKAGYWPTSTKKCRKMLKMANLKHGENFYDLGCGDGRFLIIAEKEFGAKATGIEIDPIRYLISKVACFVFTKNAKVIFGDYNKLDLKNADVIALFLQPKPIEALEKNLRKFKNGARIVSHCHKFTRLKPIKADEKDKIYLYKVKIP